ncbi:MAG: SOS response-associated peptidase family protein [Thermoplasmatota archaeon]
MEQVDALLKARLEWPQGLPFIRPQVRAPILVREEPIGNVGYRVARFGFSRRFSSFNARDDKLVDGSLWKKFFATSHAIMPLSYIVEWIPEGEAKVPVAIRRADGGLIMAPALYGPSLDRDDELGFAICTREPNDFVARIHDRMVGVCTPDLVDRWLDPTHHTASELLACIRAPDEDELVAYRVVGDITKRKTGNWSPLGFEGEPLHLQAGQAVPAPVGGFPGGSRQTKLDL